MKGVNLQSSPAGKDTETKATLANVHALSRAALENLIGISLERSPEIDMDSYLTTVVSDTIKKV